MPAQAMSTTKAIGRIVKALNGVLPRFGSNSFVKVEAADGTMRLTATNGERLLSMEIPAKGNQEPVLLPGPAFLKALKGTKSLSIDGGTVETNAAVSTFQVEDPAGNEDFQQDHAKGNPLVVLPLSPEAVEYGSYAVSHNPTQPILSSVLLDLSMKGLGRLVSTDGYRLVVAETKAKSTPKAGRYILHRTTLGSLVDLLEGQQEVRLFDRKDQLTFQGPDWTLTSRQVEGNYPRYEKVMPGELQANVTFERGAFLAAAKAMRNAGDDYNRNARIYMDQGIAVMELVHPDGPVSTAIIPFDGEADPMLPGFNYLYLSEMAEATPGEKLVFAFTPGSDGTVTFSPGKKKGLWSYQTHIMPVRWGADAPTAEEIQAKVRNALLGIVDTFGQKCEVPEGVGKKLARVLGIVLDSPVRLEALRRVRLESVHGWLNIAATDMAVTFTARIPGPAEYAPVLVEGERFRGMLKEARKLALGPKEIRSETLVLEATDAEHYPELPVAPKAYSHRVRMTREALTLVAACVKKDDLSGRLKGVLLELEQEGGVNLVASDGGRLAVARSATSTGQGIPQAATIPLKAAQILQALAEEGGMVDIQAEEEAITFHGSWWTLTARPGDRAFPNYREVIPKDAYGLMRVDRKAAQKALAVVSRLEDRYNKAMTVTLAGGIVTLKATNEGDEAVSTFPCQAEGITEGSWRMHQASLRDFVALISVPTLEMRFGGPTVAWIVRPLNEDGAWSRMGAFAPWSPAEETHQEAS